MDYYAAVAVAFGLRPFINEKNGTLLLVVDHALVVQLQQASAAEQAAVSVTLRLPFATTSAAQIMTWRSSASEKLLQRPRTLLSFPLGALPDTVNQDVAIEITLPHSRTLQKLKRLMRAPPLPAGSFVQPVQVDHSTRSLRVDGRPFQGIGWYYPYEGRNQYATFENQTQYIVHRQMPVGINHGMIYNSPTTQPSTNWRCWTSWPRSDLR